MRNTSNSEEKSSKFECRRCGIEKSLDSFGQRKGRPRSWCRECQRAYAKAHYRKNETTYKARALAQRLSNPARKAAVDKAWRQRNRERCAVNGKAWVEANKEKRRNIWRRWYAKNRAQADAASKQWMEENPLRVRERSRLLKAVRKQAAVAWGNREAILALYRESDRLTAESGIPHEVDHIVPLVSKRVCGLHWEGNLQILRRSENRSKGNRIEV